MLLLHGLQKKKIHRKLRDRTIDLEGRRKREESSIFESFDCYLGAIQCNYWLEPLKDLITDRQARQ